MTPLSPGDRPRLAAHARIVFDRTRERWIVLAPERMFILDDTARAILERCTGERSLAELIDDLCAEFDGDPAEIGRDVAALLSDLRDRGLVLR